MLPVSTSLPPRAARSSLPVKPTRDLLLILPSPSSPAAVRCCFLGGGFRGESFNQPNHFPFLYVGLDARSSLYNLCQLDLRLSSFEPGRQRLIRERWCLSEKDVCRKGRSGAQSACQKKQSACQRATGGPPECIGHASVIDLSTVMPSLSLQCFSVALTRYDPFRG